MCKVAEQSTHNSLTRVSHNIQAWQPNQLSGLLLHQLADEQQVLPSISIV